jgi:hypothetical protein
MNSSIGKIQSNIAGNSYFIKVSLTPAMHFWYELRFNASRSILGNRSPKRTRAWLVFVRWLLVETIVSNHSLHVLRGLRFNGKPSLTATPSLVLPQAWILTIKGIYVSTCELILCLSWLTDIKPQSWASNWSTLRYLVSHLKLTNRLLAIVYCSRCGLLSKPPTFTRAIVSD